MNIFVTGGAGYVGSHCVRALCDAGHRVTIFDNLSEGHRGAVEPRAEFVPGDLANRAEIDAALTGGFDAVMHFAASAYVGVSVREPLAYYRNNVANTLNLLEAMRAAEVRRIVFSSSCATYGLPSDVPIVETTPQHPINPYGRTKLVAEWMLRDSAAAWGLGACSLRYFNACGAAADGCIGEHHDPETHIIPLVLQVALGQRGSVSIFGTDYDTPDGTCIRDYIHVEDLASAHRLAIEAVEPGRARAYNVGTGQGHSVREIIETARRVTGHAIPAEDCPRRDGDPPRLVADGALIRRELGWSPEWTDITRIITSAWQWHQANPDGFAD